MHMSSCYAISLVTGSKRDLRNNPAEFKVMLQLSHSADIPPSDVTLGVANNAPTAAARAIPKDLIFVSSASLFHNHWHHVAMRWAPDQQGGQGWFVIDGVPDIQGAFSIPSSSIIPHYFPQALPNLRGMVPNRILMRFSLEIITRDTTEHQMIARSRCFLTTMLQRLSALSRFVRQKPLIRKTLISATTCKQNCMKSGSGMKPWIRS